MHNIYIPTHLYSKLLMKFASFLTLWIDLLLCHWRTVCDISSLCTVSFISICSARATLKITQKHWVLWESQAVFFLWLPLFIDVIAHKNVVMTYSPSFVNIYCLKGIFSRMFTLFQCSKSEWDRGGRALSKYHHKSSQYKLSHLFCTCSNLIKSSCGRFE